MFLLLIIFNYCITQLLGASIISFVAVMAVVGSNENIPVSFGTPGLVWPQLCGFFLFDYVHSDFSKWSCTSFIGFC